jgi:hypothetical protein
MSDEYEWPDVDEWPDGVKGRRAEGDDPDYDGVDEDE